MSQVKITLVVDGKVIPGTDGFWLSNHADTEANTLHCAEFDPPLKVNDENVRTSIILHTRVQACIS